MKKPLALLSAYKKTDALGDFAIRLLGLGYQIVASGGTKKFLLERIQDERQIIDTAKFCGQEEILHHRVVTLTPQIHAGLLADKERDVQEMGKLNWPFIDLIYVDFYPLEESMKNPDLEEEKVNELVDIGGPTMITSANKGNRIVLVSETDFAWFISRTEDGNFTIQDQAWLQAVAAARVSTYQAAVAEFRVRKLRPH